MVYFVVWTEYVDDQINTKVVQFQTKETCLDFLNQDEFKQCDPNNMVQYSIDYVIKGIEKPIKIDDVVVERRISLGE
jgi:hypothetical protein